MVCRYNGLKAKHHVLSAVVVRGQSHFGLWLFHLAFQALTLLQIHGLSLGAICTLLQLHCLSEATMQCSTFS